MFARRILATVAFVAACAQAQVQLSITNPSPSSWWVSGEVNTLAWTCGTSSQTAYTVVLSNSDKTILAAPLALIADVPDFDCSLTVSEQQSTQQPSTTYTLSLANIQNLTDIFASTQFEIKAMGSAYPTSSSTSGGATGTSTAGSASSTSPSKTGAAAANYIPVGMSMAAALFLGLVVA